MVKDFYKTLDNRMFDFSFFYEEIANQLPDNCVIAEVGVAVGTSALFLAEKLYELCKKFTLHMIDNMDYGHADQISIVYKNIVASGLGENIELLVMDSLNASCRFPDVHFDFVFIDASHKYELTKADIRLWYRKIKEGGILAGHDYNDDEGKEVKMAVDEIIPRYLYQLNEHKPKDVLKIRNTEKGYSVWFVKKNWQIKLDSHSAYYFNWQDAYISFLNLEHRKDRLEHIQNELNRVGINAIRTRGRLPNEFDLTDPKIQVMVKRTVGAVGCHFGQCEIMREALSMGKDAMVLEDDLIFGTDIKERLDYIQDFINKEDDWDVVFLGGTVHINPAWWHKLGHSSDLPMCECKLGVDAERTTDPKIIRVYGAFSTHAYIVNKRSIEKILKYFDENVHLSMGIDWLFIKMQPLLKAFMFVPGCVKQMDNRSDIGNGITYFSGFKMLGEHWFTDRIEDFNYDNFKL